MNPRSVHLFDQACQGRIISIKFRPEKARSQRNKNEDSEKIKSEPNFFASKKKKPPE